MRQDDMIYLAPLIYILCNMMRDNKNNLLQHGRNPNNAAVCHQDWMEQVQLRTRQPITREAVQLLKAYGVIKFISPSFVVPVKQQLTAQLYQLGKTQRESGT